MTERRPADPLQERRRAYRGLSRGVLLVCVGVVLLLNTLDRLGWGVWLELIKLWPLLLISLGLRWVFLKTPAHAMCLLGPALFVAGTYWVVTTYPESGSGRLGDAGDMETLTFECPPPAPGEAARLDLTFAAGPLGLTVTPHHATQSAEPPSGPPSSQATPAPRSGGIKGTVRYAGRQPRQSCAGTGTLRLRPPVHVPGITLVAPFAQWRNEWDARLEAGSPVSLVLRLAAASAEVDVRTLTVQRVQMDAVASSVLLRLGPPAGRVPVRIHGLADELTLVMPAGTCYTVTRNWALSVIDVDDETPTEGKGRHLSASACASAGPDVPRYEVRLEAPVSSVSLETEGHTL